MYDPSKPMKQATIDLISSTWDTPYISVRQNVYPIISRKYVLPEVEHTDGIGTKGIYHWKAKTFEYAVQDALAMNLNDMLLVRARPTTLQNHLTLPTEDQKAITTVLETLVKECRQREIAMTGGETSIHNNTNTLDLSITMSGFIERVRRNAFHDGDLLVGLPSSGLHSNGFTMVRRMFGEVVRDELTEPTTIYFDDVYPLFSQHTIHGMMHITGGAYTKILDVIDGVDVEIARNHYITPHDIFKEMYERNFTDEEMYTTFNCGIGFIISAPEFDAHNIANELDGAEIIGHVEEGDNMVRIQSSFSPKEIVFQK